ncbi:hypothetical protein L3i23_03060 [Herbiconiux sp. L3-i23]|nr:hypothetical protein L3i23_03060 [Herbiconiux sp. L3-i23]
MRAAGDRGAGSALAIGLVAAVVIVTVTLVPLYTAFASARRLAVTADAAALAAADTASGAVPGVPCEAAEAVARLGGARLVECDVESAIAAVTLSASVLGMELDAPSRAGPPTAVGERHDVGGRGDD